MDKTLSVVTMFHDMGDWTRDYFGLYLAQRYSLVHNTTPPENHIVIDSTPYDEMPNYMNHLTNDDLIIQYPLSIFNKSKALNYGLSLVETKYVAFTDIDFIFHLRAIEEIKKVMSGNRMILGIASYLRDRPRLRFPFPWAEIISAPLEHPRAKKLSPGTIQVAPTSWFRKIGGYDERYEGGLGGMDDDMKRRAMEDGLELYWIEEPLFFHCPHKRSSLKGKCSHIYHGEK